MNDDDACARCGSTDIQHSWAMGGPVVHACNRCGLGWGDHGAYHAALATVLAEEAAKPKPPAFRGPGPDMFLPGVNPWWFA